MEDKMSAKPRANAYKKADDAIVQAFFSLLEDRDFHKITVSDIIKKAGVNRSTFYRHYVDKYDILDQIKKESLPRGDLMMATFADGRRPFDVLFNSDYIDRCVPESYKKTLMLLLRVRTDSFDMEKIVKDGFSRQYQPDDNSPDVKLQRQLYADICYRLLIYALSNDGKKKDVNIYEAFEKLSKYLEPQEKLTLNNE